MHVNKIKWLIAGFVFFCFLGTEATAQNTRSVEEVLKARSARQTNVKRDKKGIFGIFKNKNKVKTDYDAQVAFKKRMSANIKEDRKEGRMSSKKRYSDFTYFGHKRKPKKRPVGKRKFCKECGIVH